MNIFLKILILLVFIHTIVYGISIDIEDLLTNLKVEIADAEKQTNEFRTFLIARNKPDQITELNTYTKIYLKRAHGIKQALEDVRGGAKISQVLESAIAEESILLKRKAVFEKQGGLPELIELNHEKLEIIQSKIKTLQEIKVKPSELNTVIIDNVKKAQTLTGQQIKFIQKIKTSIGAYTSIPINAPPARKSAIDIKRGGIVTNPDENIIVIPDQNKSTLSDAEFNRLKEKFQSANITEYDKQRYLKEQWARNTPQFKISPRISSSFKYGIIGLGFDVMHEMVSQQGNLNQAKLYITGTQAIQLDEEILRRKGEECDALKIRIAIRMAINIPIDDNFKILLNQSIACAKQYNELYKTLNNKKRKLQSITEKLNAWSNTSRKMLLEQAKNELQSEDYQHGYQWPTTDEDPTLFRYFRVREPVID